MQLSMRLSFSSYAWSLLALIREILADYDYYYVESLKLSLSVILKYYQLGCSMLQAEEYYYDNSYG